MKKIICAVLLVFILASSLNGCAGQKHTEGKKQSITEEANVDSTEKKADMADEETTTLQKEETTTQKQITVEVQATTTAQKEETTTEKKPQTTTAAKKETQTTVKKEETTTAATTKKPETTEEEKEAATSSTEEEKNVTSWVADLKAAQNTDQLMIVAASGSTATVSLHNKVEEGIWKEILSTSASIGKNGIGKTSEGDKKTPTGKYKFMFGFGIKSNPGTAFSYTQVDDTYYWVDDVNSQYYNKFVTTKEVEQDWTSAEHIIESSPSYNYALAINYNTACVPGAGSAIFLHCKPSGGAGCIAVSESVMIQIMKNVSTDCVLIIDSKDNVLQY